MYNLHLLKDKPSEKEKLLNSLKLFSEQFLISKSTLFGPIGEFNLESRAKNRAAEKLPCNDNIRNIVENCEKAILKVSYSEPHCESKFIEIRRACVLRLIFFNGKCPSEISNLKIIQWRLAKENFYLTTQQKTSLKMKGLESLLENFKVIVNIGKSHDISIVIPKFIWSALDYLSDENVRTESNIHSNNPYLFPSGKRSIEASSGPDNVNSFIKSCNLDKNCKISSVKVIICLVNF